MDPFLGEIRLFPWDWAPTGWRLCDGSILPISQYTALFALLGTQYGGDGRTNFALPDLRGRAPIHFGSSYSQGETDGSETVSLTLSTMPAHNHALQGTSTIGDKPSPINNSLAQLASTAHPHYSAPAPAVALNPASVQPAGSGQPHENMQPFLVLNFCIATNGIFPSRS